MPPISKTAVQFNGLQTYPGPLGSTQPGALLQADNIVVDRPGVLQPRPGFGLVPWLQAGNSLSSVAPIGAGAWGTFAQWDTNVMGTYLASVSSSTVMILNYPLDTDAVPASTLGNGLTVSTPSFGGVLDPTSRVVQWSGYGFINLKSGLGLVQAGLTPSAYVDLTPAGLPPGPQVQAAVIDAYQGIAYPPTTTSFSMTITSGSALLAGDIVGYSALWGQALPDGTQTFGAVGPTATVASNFDQVLFARYASPFYGYAGNFSPWKPGTTDPWNLVFKASDGRSFPTRSSVSLSYPDGVPGYLLQGSNTALAAMGGMTGASSPSAFVTLDPSAPAQYFGAASSPVTFAIKSQIVSTSSVSPSTTALTLGGAFDLSSVYPFSGYSNTTDSIAVVTGLDPAQWETGALATTSISSWTASQVVVVPVSGSAASTYSVGGEIAILISGTIITPQLPAFAYLDLIPTASWATFSGTVPAVGDVVSFGGTISYSVLAPTAGALVHGASPSPPSFPYYPLVNMGLSAFPISVVATPMLVGQFQLSLAAGERGSTLGALGAFINVANAAGSLISEMSIGRNYNVQVTVPGNKWLETWIQASGTPNAYYGQIYRSPGLSTNNGSNATPNPNQQLVDQFTVSGPTSSTHSVVTLYPYTDIAPDTVLTTALYSNPNQGIQPYYPAPVAVDLTWNQNSLLLANVGEAANGMFSLLATAPSASSSSTPQLQPGDTVTLSAVWTDGTTSSATYSAVTTSTATGPTFKVVSGSGSISEDINETVANLCWAINTYPLWVSDDTQVLARPNSGQNDQPGGFILLTGQGLATVTLSYTSAHGGNPNPFTGTATIQSTYYGNRVHFSEASQPQSFPLLNYITVGTAAYGIQRILTCQAGTYAFKRDGIYQITGDPTAFSSQQIDTTAQLLGERTAVAFQDNIFAFTTNGVISIGTGGVQVISQNIHGELLALSKLENFATQAFAVADQPGRRYLLFVPQSPTDTQATLCYAYNVFTNAWTRWDIFAQTGLASLGDNLLYLGQAPHTSVTVVGAGAAIQQERAQDPETLGLQYADESIVGGTVSAGSTASQLTVNFTLTPPGASYSLYSAWTTSAFAVFNGGMIGDGDGNGGRISTIDSVTISGGSLGLPVSAVIQATMSSAADAQAAIDATSPSTAVMLMPINTRWQVLVAGDEPGAVKQWQEYTMHFQQTTEPNHYVELRTDYGFDNTIVNLVPYEANAPESDFIASIAGGWGNLPWGQFAWGTGTYVAPPTWSEETTVSTSTEYQSARQWVTQNTSRGHVLYMTVTSAVCQTTMNVIGLTMNWLGTQTTFQK